MPCEAFFIKAELLAPPNKAEILRYMRAPSGDPAGCHLPGECLPQAMAALDCRVCGKELALTVDELGVTLDGIEVKSRSLANYFRDCSRVFAFAATVGIHLDRLILRHSSTSPATALCYHAIGTERIEALADYFCENLAKRYEKSGTLKPRFSPGYGDAPLSLQRQLFALLDCTRHIGITLTDTGLITPTKSITALVGIKERK